MIWIKEFRLCRAAAIRIVENPALAGCPQDRQPR